jgi:TonB family protein
LGGSSSRPDVLSEATDLDTLFEAIVGKPMAPADAAEPERRSQPVSRTEGVPRPKSAVAETPAPIREPSKPFEWPPADAAAGVPAPPLEAKPTEPPAALDDSDEIDDIEDETPSQAAVDRLQFMRTSPWPIMIVLGGMALVTVSAIGLRGGSSPAAEIPPAVAPPATTQPEGYAAPPPALPVPAGEAATQPSTAIGESPFKPTGPAARGATATSAASSPATPTAAASKPAATSATKPSSPPPAPAVFAPAPAAVEPPPSAPAAAARVEEAAAEPSTEAVRVIEPPAPPLEPKTEAPAPIATPPAVSSARPDTSEAEAEVPRPVAPRTGVPMVAARRLAGGMPEYSSAMRQQKIGGVVEVQIRIDLNGRVVSAIAVSGPPPLRQAAEAAVLKWRYAPATRNGIPIETEIKVSFSFDPSQNRRP